VFRHVGTLNKSLAVDPASGNLFVATIEAMNLNRFLSVPRLGAFPNPMPAAGVAPTADPATGKTLNGHLYESRVAILSADGKVTSRHLNKHIDYEVVPSPAGVKERSVADPQGLAFSRDGQTLFVAGLGSNKIVPFRKAALEDDSFQPDAASHIQLSGDGGPTDMVLSADGARMFVYKRFDNAIATVDLAAREEVAVTPLFTPEPAEVRVGRKFFYDATLTSSNGEANCNVCHPGADKDDLAWDLATPFEGVKPNPNSLPANFDLDRIIGAFLGGGGAGGTGGAGGAGGAAGAGGAGAGGAAGGAGAGGGTLPARTDVSRFFSEGFNPLKGPMTVLTLRGIKDGGPMLWRGDATNEADPLDERANFKTLDVLFEALLGRAEPLPERDFDRFTDWVLTVTNPPNPNRPLDNQLTASQEAGRVLYFGEERPVDGPLTCNDCHFTDPAQGFFGTRGEFFPEGQNFKVTGLRPMYDKIGSAGRNNGRAGDPRVKGGARTNAGPQIRGGGTLHDGTMASAEEFLALPIGFALNDVEIAQVADFLNAFPTDFAPVVGQQVTLRADSTPDALARVDLFEQRAAATFVMPGNTVARECELVAKLVQDGRERGFLFDPADQTFRDDQGARIARADLRALAQTPGQEITFTCMYPGGGTRVALDRDEDGRLNGQPR
jgi:cytochrome c peroxidase